MALSSPEQATVSGQSASVGSGTRGTEREREPSSASKALSEQETVQKRDAAVDERPVFSLVMPTLNEELGVADCIQNAQAAFEMLGLPGEIIVSDSSSDATPAIAQAMGARVVTPDRRGYGYAYRFAFEHARGEYVVIGDADGTYDFAELPRLFEAMQRENADMVVGSRFSGEIRPGAMPALHQHVGNPALTGLLNLLYGLDVSDAHSGFRVVRRDALDRLGLRSNGMEFASEMIMAAGAAGLRIVEVPITYHPRKGEAKLSSFRDGWRHVKFMLANAPTPVFALPGLVSVALGVVLLGLAPLGLVGFDHAGALLVGCLTLFVGVQLGAMAFLSGVTGRAIRPPTDPATRLAARWFTLERGLVAGALVALVGALSLWTIFDGGAFALTLPRPYVDALAATALGIGVYVCFASLLAESLAVR